jgi:replicative superfamily II helicase
VSIDFSDLLDDDDTAVVHPRDIFFTLNRDPAFSFPRDIQTEVMNLWFDRRTEKDTILKLNVGSGKTLVGLLLLQSCLNEEMAPALYVAPDNQLVDQVMVEADALGIAVTDNPKDPGFQAGEKIAVVNIYKLFNGRSVFGVGNEGSKIRVGSIVIDDAHACVATVTEQFRITLPNTHEAYQVILGTLSDDLKRQSEARYLDVKDGDPRAVIEVPFWSWQMHQSDILSSLHQHRTKTLRWSHLFGQFGGEVKVYSGC